MTEALPAPAAGWDCHVHVFSADAPVPESHYRPRPRPLSEIESLGAANGVGHLVLVQPSVYGTDNRVLLEALATQPGRHRGVVVVPATIDEASLEAMHALGVRGVRVNRVSPVGLGDTEGLARLAPVLRRLGWHVQWYVAPSMLGEVVALQRALGLPVVLDHLAGLHAGSEDLVAAWQALRELAEAGAWVKLSGWYRLQAAAPYDALDGIVGRIDELFGARLVWGSDWPHTSFDPAALPPYGALRDPIRRVLGELAERRVLNEGPAALYR